MKNREHFRIKSVKAGEPYNLTLTFADGVTMKVDLSALIARIPALAPLKEHVLFLKACVGKSGLTVDWIPGELDMAGDNLRAEGIEQSGGISHERIWEWMYRNGLTLNAAAEELGISRRMLAYYRSGQKPVPRHIWLACLGWEVERQKAA
jgi:hypothetical protein